MWVINCLLALSTWVAVTRGQCSISLNDDMPEIEPLILHPETAGSFRYPNKEGNLELLKNEQVRIVCSGEGNYFVNLGDQTTKINDTVANCDRNTNLIVSDKSIKVKELECKFWPAIQQNSAGQCSESYSNYEIGFKLDNDFIKLIEVCHDEAQVVTLYTQFDLVKQISGARKLSSCPPSMDCPNDDICYDAQYDPSAELDTFSQILGSRHQAMEFVRKNSKNYVSRGHLVSNTDFIYDSQKRATYYYINQAPQWEVCNTDSWSYLEEAIRSYASSTNQDLTVYTGVHQIAQLPDANDTQHDLYLRISDDGIQTIPVPRFFWKVIYNKATKRGTAFVEINNQYLGFFTADYKICDRFLVRTRWDLENRACLWYNCEVDELRRHNVILPPFDVVGILQ